MRLILHHPLGPQTNYAKIERYLTDNLSIKLLFSQEREVQVLNEARLTKDKKGKNQALKPCINTEINQMVFKKQTILQNPVKS